MQERTRILLKLSGQIFNDRTTNKPDSRTITTIVEQIKELSGSYQFGIVIGGGNFFRGSIQGKQLGLSSWSAHNAGMLATLINGVMLRDILNRHAIDTLLVSALPCSTIAEPITQQAVDDARKKGYCILFAGGTGNPYFTTDTNAILRALQMDTKVVWKGTSVDGVYSEDPAKNLAAKKMSRISYTQALEQKLAIMDATAFTLAQEHDILIRVFDIFASDALIRAAQELSFGTIITQ